jgi:uncharacterized membrane protein
LGSLPAERDTVADRFYRFVTWLLAFALAASLLGAMVVAVSPPQPTQSYSEFYVLAEDGRAEDYPTNLTVGETGRLLVGVSNHEYDDQTYTVAVALGDRTVTTRTLSVAADRTAERRVSFSPTEPGRERLRLLLYRGSDSTGDPYRRLRLLVNVSATSR